jgi:hypothetical protein
MRSHAEGRRFETIDTVTGTAVTFIRPKLELSGMSVGMTIDATCAGNWSTEV